MAERVKAAGGAGRRRGAGRTAFAVSAAALAALLAVACFEPPLGDRYYGEVPVPRSQEFRWSNGGLPRVFDPARAAAPPDTDAVRALYEGLTDYEPKTLSPQPAVAQRWETTDGGRTWLFHLRDDSRWSNGDVVTAADFVRSWRRTLRLGESAPHARLLAVIAGAAGSRREAPVAAATPAAPTPTVPAAATGSRPAETTAETSSPGGEAEAGVARPAPTPEPFGAVALDERTLRVTLKRPDPNFPSLVAHPVFRPVHELSPPLELPTLAEDPFGGAPRGDLGIVTNGAFRLSEVSGRNVVLERDADYWDAGSVRLERVTFVNGGDAEGMLAAYRAGEVDAVTNASFEPLALKLLAPYEDFRRGTFAALNYYRFNASRPPFNDRRVREAFTLALDADRLAADVLGGAVQSARRYLPFGGAPAGAESPDVAGEVKARDTSGDEDSVESGSGAGSIGEIRPDPVRAARLLAEAGYPNGENFPRVRLLVNRNEQQRLVANAVARMWRETLGVETEVMVRPWEEYEAMLKAGDYDIARRSLVMQTLDEAANVLAILADETAPTPPAASPQSSPPASPQTPAAASGAGTTAEAGAASDAAANAPLTEADALRELPAIPLYFSSSYGLVKPYVVGFESNLLDAPSLKRVSINTSWAPPSPSPQPAAVVNSTR
jgi:ABC-type oligopeptide transport system substrate-binding subunit